MHHAVSMHVKLTRRFLSLSSYENQTMSSLNYLCSAIGMPLLRYSLVPRPIPRIFTTSKPTARLKNDIKLLGEARVQEAFPGADSLIRCLLAELLLLDSHVKGELL